MPMLQSSIHVFPRVARRCTDSKFSNLFSDGSMIYVTDTAVALRSSSFTLPDVIPDSPAVDTLIRAFDKYANIADRRLAALGPKAKCPGEYPIIAENLRAYARFAKSQGQKYALYPLGDSFVNAALLADVLDAIPDACVYAVPGDPYKPLFFRGQYAEGLLFPFRAMPQDIIRHLQRLADYQRESGEQGAVPSHPFMTIPLDKIYEQAEAEDKRQQEAQRQQEQEREAYIRQRQSEETAQREQSEKEKAEKRESTRKTLLSDGENMPVDGAALCELAAEMGVSIPLRTKGWILQKLRAVTIQAGEVASVSFQPTRKHEQGSGKAFDVINAVISALKMESLAQSCDGIPEKKDPQPENQPKKVQNPIPNTQNIPMPAFQARFAQEYNFLYDCRGNVPGYQEAVSAFEAACQYPAFMDFVRRFVQYRDGDTVSSDRECAAFMRALEALNHPPANPSRPYLDLLSLSAGTVAALARQKGRPCESYDDINYFHSAVTLTACFMDCTRFENWQQLFEAAYAVAFPQNNGGQSCNQTQNLPSVTKSAEKCDANAQNSTEISAEDTAPDQKNTPRRPKKKRHKQPGEAQKRKAAAQTFRIFLDYDVQHFGHVRPETYDAIQSQKHKRKRQPSELATGPGLSFPQS